MRRMLFATTETSVSNGLRLLFARQHGGVYVFGESARSSRSGIAYGIPRDARCSETTGPTGTSDSPQLPSLCKPAIA